jgi:hypothetical protein
MDISFLYTYKGALYPIEGAREDNDSEAGASGGVPTLVDIICRHLVQDAASTERALPWVDPVLCYDLMKAALRDTRDRTIEVRGIREGSGH